jgi:hypothetical protein
MLDSDLQSGAVISRSASGSWAEHVDAVYLVGCSQGPRGSTSHVLPRTTAVVLSHGVATNRRPCHPSRSSGRGGACRLSRLTAAYAHGGMNMAAEAPADHRRGGILHRRCHGRPDQEAALENTPQRTIARRSTTCASGGPDAEATGAVGTAHSVISTRGCRLRRALASDAPADLCRTRSTSRSAVRARRPPATTERPAQGDRIDRVRRRVACPYLRSRSSDARV